MRERRSEAPARICQSPRSTGTTSPVVVMPSTASSGLPIMKSTWTRALVDPRLVRRILDRMVVPVPERDVGRGVLVDQRVEEDGLERPDPPLAVDERDLAEPCCPLVHRDDGPEGVGALLRVDLDGLAARELDADAAR